MKYPKIEKGCIEGDCENGFGIYIDYEDKKYEGHWKDGEKHGLGKKFLKSGTLLYEGEWKKSKRDGQGTEYYKNGNLYYIGEWENDKRHGQGTCFDENGLIYYEGQREDDKRHGDGIKYGKDGHLCCEGQWENGKFTGIKNQSEKVPVSDDELNLICRKDASGMKKLKAFLNKLSIKMPLIPESLQKEMKQFGEYTFATCQKDMHPYNLFEFVQELIDKPDIKDYAVISHTGHGINSYALQYYLVYKQLAIFLHLSLGGVYGDYEEDANKISATFSQLNHIIAETNKKTVMIFDNYVDMHSSLCNI